MLRFQKLAVGLGCLVIAYTALFPTWFTEETRQSAGPRPPGGRPTNLIRQQLGRSPLWAQPDQSARIDIAVMLAYWVGTAAIVVPLVFITRRRPKP